MHLRPEEPAAIEVAETPVTVAAALREAVAVLELAGVEQARLEARLLLAHVLDRDHAWLLSHPEAPIVPTPAARYAALLARRVQREPLAYLTRERDWRDLSLEVARSVLIPRPETEQLVDLALAEVQARLAWVAGSRGAPLVVDVGTGSGAIAIAIARACPAAHVFATDSSPDALRVAARNVERLAAGRVTLLEGDLIAPLPAPPDVVVANLPYIPGADIAALAPELSYEPRSALDGGADGLDVIRALFGQLQQRGLSGASVLLEIGHDQAPAVVCLAHETWPRARIETARDLAGIDRFVSVHIPAAGEAMPEAGG